MSPVPFLFLLLASLVSAHSTVTVTRTTVSPSIALSRLASSSAQQTATVSRAISPSSSITATSTITAVSECHMHETIQYCKAGTAEYQALKTATGTSALPAQDTGCHSQGSKSFCFAPSGDEVELQLQGAEEPPSTATGDAATPTGKRKCHYHNGVEHCFGGDENEETPSCGKIEREYNITLRVGLLFVILLTSGMGKFFPKGIILDDTNPIF